MVYVFPVALGEIERIASVRITFRRNVFSQLVIVLIEAGQIVSKPFLCSRDEYAR